MRGERGIALIMAVGVLAVLTVIGIAFTTRMRDEIVSASNFVRAAKARAVADAGLAHAMSVLARDVDERDTFAGDNPGEGHQAGPLSYEFWGAPEEAGDLNPLCTQWDWYGDPWGYAYLSWHYAESPFAPGEPLGYTGSATPYENFWQHIWNNVRVMRDDGSFERPADAGYDVDPLPIHFSYDWNAPPDPLRPNEFAIMLHMLSPEVSLDDPYFTATWSDTAPGGADTVRDLYDALAGGKPRYGDKELKEVFWHGWYDGIGTGEARPVVAAWNYVYEDTGDEVYGRYWVFIEDELARLDANFLLPRRLGSSLDNFYRHNEGWTAFELDPYRALWSGFRVVGLLSSNLDRRAVVRTGPVSEFVQRAADWVHRMPPMATQLYPIMPGYPALGPYYLDADSVDNNADGKYDGNDDVYGWARRHFQGLPEVYYPSWFCPSDPLFQDAMNEDAKRLTMDRPFSSPAEVFAAMGDEDDPSANFAQEDARRMLRDAIDRYLTVYSRSVNRFFDALDVDGDGVYDEERTYAGKTFGTYDVLRGASPPAGGEPGSEGKLHALWEDQIYLNKFVHGASSGEIGDLVNILQAYCRVPNLLAVQFALNVVDYIDDDTKPEPTKYLYQGFPIYGNDVQQYYVVHVEAVGSSGGYVRSLLPPGARVEDIEGTRGNTLDDLGRYLVLYAPPGCTGVTVNPRNWKWSTDYNNPPLNQDADPAFYDAFTGLPRPNPVLNGNDVIVVGERVRVWYSLPPTYAPWQPLDVYVPSGLTYYYSSDDDASHGLDYLSSGGGAVDTGRSLARYGSAGMFNGVTVRDPRCGAFVPAWEPHSPGLVDWQDYLVGSGGWFDEQASLWPATPAAGLENANWRNSFFYKNGPLANVGELGSVHIGLPWTSLPLRYDLLEDMAKYPVAWRGGYEGDSLVDDDGFSPVDFTNIFSYVFAAPTDWRGYTWGRVNINTAPYEVLLALFTCFGDDVAQDLAKAVVIFRDHPDDPRNWYDWREGVPTARSGGAPSGYEDYVIPPRRVPFANVTHLLHAVKPVWDYYESIGGFPEYPGWDWANWVLAYRPSGGTLKHTPLDPGNPPGDDLVREYWFRAISNLVTVRSDVFRVTVLGQVGRDLYDSSGDRVPNRSLGDFGDLIFATRRLTAIVDRTRMLRAGDDNPATNRVYERTARNADIVYFLEEAR